MNEPLTLLDVILLEPTPSYWGWFFISIIISICILVGIYFSRKSKTVQSDTAKAKIPSINSIQKSWEVRALSDRQAAFFLTQLLCNTINIKQLTQSPPKILNCDEDHWVEFITTVNGLKYQNQPQSGLNSEIFSWVKKWLAMEKHGDNISV